MTKKVDAHPMAFLNMARKYYESANALVGLGKRTPPIGIDPIYYLYLHAIELALKAYLRAYDLPILGTSRKSHEVLELYAECQTLGLVVGPDDRVGIRNIVDMLEESNEAQGLRYFNGKSRVVPDLEWTGREVGELLAAVAAQVEKRHPGSSVPGPAVRGTMIISITQPELKRGA